MADARHKTQEIGASSLFPLRYEATLAIVERLYPKLERGVSEMFAGAAAMLEQSQERLEVALTAFYQADARACARVCDEVLDPSGALLGEVREWAK